MPNNTARRPCCDPAVCCAVLLIGSFAIIGQIEDPEQQQIAGIILVVLVGLAIIGRIRVCQRQGYRDRLTVNSFCDILCLPALGCMTILNVLATARFNIRDLGRTLCCPWRAKEAHGSGSAAAQLRMWFAARLRPDAGSAATTTATEAAIEVRVEVPEEEGAPT